MSHLSEVSTTPKRSVQEDLLTECHHAPIIAPMATKKTKRAKLKVARGGKISTNPMTLYPPTSAVRDQIVEYVEEENIERQAAGQTRMSVSSFMIQCALSHIIKHKKKAA